MPKVLFTSATAKEMVRKRWDAVHAAKANAPQPIVSHDPTTNEPLPPDLARVRAKLDKLDLLMDQADDDKQWDTLSRAYERMFRVWCTLTKTPGPGNLKPQSPSRQQRRAIPEPVAIPPVQGDSQPIQ
jgi:hypothetical protein